GELAVDREADQREADRRGGQHLEAERPAEGIHACSSGRMEPALSPVIRPAHDRRDTPGRRSSPATPVRATQKPRPGRGFASATPLPRGAAYSASACGRSTSSTYAIGA